MSRRRTGNMRGERYLGNAKSKEVHDLDFEKLSCQIDKIIKAGHDRPLPSVEIAKTYGFDNCAHCLGGSLR